MEFDKYGKMLAQNHDFLSGWYGDMQGKLTEKNALIMTERQQWEQAKLEIRQMSKMDGEVIPLNVGGTHHLMTELEVLT